MATVRIDGRGPGELRPTLVTRRYVKTSAGAVMMECGDTRVLCTVSLEDRVPPFLVGRNSGWLTAEYGMLPGSSPTRVARECSAILRPTICGQSTTALCSDSFLESPRFLTTSARILPIGSTRLCPCLTRPCLTVASPFPPRPRSAPPLRLPPRRRSAGSTS